MFGYALRRLAIAVPTVLLAVFCVFAAVRSLPNNPVLARMGQHVVPEQVAEAMAKHGWDQPLWKQWFAFLGRAASGDLGESFITGETVGPDLFRRFAATLELTFAAMAIALPVGLALGVSGAVWRNKAPDFLCTAASLIGVSVPVFFLGL
ncbi:MAG TPA: ABC transporter permease, partial [Pirellulales bacterium]